MKNGLLLFLLMFSLFAQGQSLKEALFSGKLKSAPGTVIRKGDDLSAFIDTTTKAPVFDSARAKAAQPGNNTAPFSRPSDAAAAAAPPDSAAAAITESAEDEETATEAVAATEAAAPKAAAPKDNNAIWKDYVTGIVEEVKKEALSSKKIKKGTYYASVGYTIETDGQVTVNDVTLSPESSELQRQLKERISREAPTLTPVLNSTGNPRKVTRRYNFNLTKE